MAIDMATEYTNATAPSASYPGGSFKNEVTPGVSGDGTPVEKEWADDWLGFLHKLTEDANITVSGAADTVVASDRFDGLMALCGYNPSFEDSGSANTYQVSPFKSGQTIDEYYDGMLVVFLATNDNSGASTLQVGSLAAKDLIYTSGEALQAGAVLENRLTIARYDAGVDDFYLLNPQADYSDISGFSTGSTAETDMIAQRLPIDEHNEWNGIEITGDFQIVDSVGSITTTIKFYLGANSMTIFTGALSGAGVRNLQVKVKIMYRGGGSNTSHRVTAVYVMTTGTSTESTHYQQILLTHDFNASSPQVKFTAQVSSVSATITQWDMLTRKF